MLDGLKNLSEDSQNDSDVFCADDEHTKRNKQSDGFQKDYEDIGKQGKDDKFEKLYKTYFEIEETTSNKNTEEMIPSPQKDSIDRKIQ